MPLQWETLLGDKLLEVNIGRDLWALKGLTQNCRDAIFFLAINKHFVWHLDRGLGHRVVSEAKSLTSIP